MDVARSLVRRKGKSGKRLATRHHSARLKPMSEFPKPEVIAALEPFMLLQADVTENDDDDKALLNYFGSFGPPTIAFYDAAGQEQPAYKLVGYVEAEEFTAHVKNLAAL